MNRDAHLSIRLTSAEKQALEGAARASDTTVGQLVRRAVRQITGCSAGAPAREGGRGRPIVQKACRPVRRERELRWLEEHREELSAYRGNWVVVQDERLVTFGPDLRSVTEQARCEGIDVPFVEWVPDFTSHGFSMGL